MPFQQMPIPVHSMGPDGLLLAVNDAWIAFTGYSREQAVGHSFAAFLEASSAKRYRDKAVPELIGDVLSIESRSVEYQLIRQSGELANIVLTARPERDPATGAFLHSLAVLSDITARNRAETTARQAQKLEALGSLTGGVAHDFNNLLMVIIGSLQLLQKRLPEGDARAARLLDAAMQGAERGAALTGRLLAFSRQQELSPKSIHLPDLLGSVERMLSPVLGPTIQVDQHVPPGLWNLRADPGQLEVALVNLALNARDAMQEGGILRIGARNATTVTSGTAFFGSAPHPAPAGGEYVVLAITDTGSGMDEATLARAADPFFTTKGPGKGTGLGLSMVHGFVLQSGGALHLVSRPSQGTTVELWLPRSLGSAGAAPSPAAHFNPPAGQAALRILLVDDDPLVLNGTAGMLEHLGHTVACCANSGREALVALHTEAKIDLLLTDHLMPGMNGLELAREATRLRPALPVLLVSGFPDFEAADFKSMDNAAFARLRKPYSLADLSEALATIRPAAEHPC